MVLSAPAAHAAPPAAPWLDRLSRIFQLGRGRGVLVLVRGGPERLGDVVRCVVGLSPGADVLVRADALSSLAPESTAVLCLRPQDFDWLNIGRPVVLGHRVVLFGDAATALALERHAVDFCDWISHRIDAPPGPPPFAVRALLDAACARSRAVVWKGGDVEAVFSEALPGRSLSRVSAALPYADLVEALRPRPRTWVLVTDVDSSFRALRVSWAAAEAGRYGRTILVRPGGDMPGLAVAHAISAPIEEAAAKLEEAGIGHGARLAALLELEPEAIERAVAMAKGGVSEAEIAGRLGEIVRFPLPPRGAAPRLPGWPERVELALLLGDDDVASYWAARWRAMEPGNARATAALAYVRVGREDLDGARALLAEASAQAGPHPDADTAFELRRLEGMIHAEARAHAKALRAIDEAIRLLRKTHRPPEDADLLSLLRVRCLVNLGRLKEAERTIEDWPVRTHPSGGGRNVAMALLKLARGQVESVVPFFQRTLDSLGERDTRIGAFLVQVLAQALLHQGAFGEAERLTRAAILKAEQHGRSTGFLVHEHARALFGLGRFGEAEREFRRILTTIPVGADTAATRHELARCLSAQGRLEEAETVLDEAIMELRDAPPRGAALSLSLLYEKAHLHLLRGNADEAAALFGEVLRGEERALGRDHPTLRQTLTALGDSLIQSGEPAAAQPHLRRAHRIAERSGDDAGVAVALGHLAVAQAMQRFPQAADTARRALEAWSRSGRRPAPAFLADLEAIASGAALPPSPS